MTDSKAKSIPQWQRQAVTKSSSETPGEQDDETQTPDDLPPSSRARLIEQATKFLEEEEIRDASTDKKISFLISKGLTNEEIENLLGVSRNEEASTHSESSQHKASPSDQGDSSQATSLMPSLSPPSEPLPPASTPSSTPPIITYPEFLLQSAQPPPLITAPRVLAAVYASSIAAAAMYTTNTYLLAPMLSTLTTARHSLFSTTAENLTTLNTKLESLVSELPPVTHRSTEDSLEKEEDDVDSETSDPTELFHRDIGIQTSPPLSPSLSSSAITTSTPLDTQTSRLYSLREHLASLLDTSTSALDESEGLKHRVADVQALLDEVRFGQSRNFGHGYSFGPSGGEKEREADEMERFKREIRAVKGVLLSAKTFPAGVRGEVGR